MNLPVLSGQPASVSCTSCAFRAECGGLDDQQTMWGCFSACSSDCVTDGCDWTCPSNPTVFVERTREVGGLSSESPTLKPLKADLLPAYIPTIHHGYGRGVGSDALLDVQVAAISIKDLFRHRGDGHLELVAQDAPSLRRHFGLRTDSNVLVVSVAQDRPLELYWAHRRLDGLPQRLAELGLLGMTLPNFSFFTDAPRTHSLWNRKRMLRAGAELSNAGLPVAPHLNALTSEDWRFWKEFLTAHPEIGVVAKEFQTGLREKQKATDAIAALAALQDSIGRPLHLIAVGATRYAVELRHQFGSVTFVDSTPFMRAMKRRARMLENATTWKRVSVPCGHELRDLLNGNIIQHAAFVAGSVR